MASEKSPKVTIVLPTYNRAESLSRAIESARTQSLTDWEMVVIDDSSNDGTKEMLEGFVMRDPRITVIRNEHSDYAEVGITKVLNQGLAAARAPYVARLDDDDYWIDDRKLEKQVKYLDEHPDCVVVGGGVVVVDGAGSERYRYLKKESDEALRDTALLANPFSHTTVMFRAATARAVGGYRARYAEDWDLWLSMGTKGTFYNFQEYFTGYTMNNQNKSFIHQRRMTRVILQFISAHRKEYPGFFKGYFLNSGQYLYTFLPVGVRKYLQGRLSAIKRGI